MLSNNIVISKAKMKDLERVVELFQNAIDHMNKNDIPQWDEIYPDENILREDISKNQLYLGKIGEDIVSAFVINEEYDEEYKNGQWRYPESSYQVIHRLCVNVNYQNQGIGKRTLYLIEDILKEKAVETIRLDAFSKNPSALKLYEGLGYIRVGEVNFRKGLFYLYEKKI